MPTCELRISFSPDDLAVLRAAGENVVIVAGVDAIVTSAPSDFATAGENAVIVAGVDAIVTSAPSDFAGLNAAVAWLAFPPFERNQVSWSTQGVQLYAASAAPPNLAVAVAAQSDAGVAQVRPFANGAFGPPAGSLRRGLYGVANKQANRASMVFGLALGATVNGDASQAGPMNASLVPLNQNARFAPNGTIQVFMQTPSCNGMVLPDPIANVPSYRIDGGTPALALRYDRATASFLPA